VATRRVEITRSAHRDLDALSSPTGRRVLAAIVGLSGDARPHGFRKLTGSLNSYRVRVGNYRILYVIDDAEALITVFAVGHRREIYR